MRPTIPTMLTVAALAFAAAPALAEGGADTPRGQGPMMGQGRMMGQGMMGEDGAMRGGKGPMHHRMHHGRRGGGMMGQGGRGAMMGMGSPAMMAVVFILADTNGNGTLSLEEVLAVEERFFRHIDADGDGEMTREELRGFMRMMAGRGPGRFGDGDATGTDTDDDDG